MKEILFRPADENMDAWIRQTAQAHKRPISEEIRAAIAVYRDLIELAHVKSLTARQGQEAALADLERRLRDNLGRVLLPALTDPARQKFEHDTHVEYPTDRIAHVSMPFEKVAPWVVRETE